DRYASMELGNVVDQLHDDDCLPHPGSAECANLSALQERTNQVDHLDSSGKELRRRRLIDQGRRWPMNRIKLFGVDWAALVHWSSGHIEYAPHDTIADRHRNGSAAVGHVVTTLQSLGAIHGNCPNPFIPDVLLDLERNFRGPVLDFI